MISVKYKKLHPAAVAPKQAHQGDAGFDLTVTRVKRLGICKVEYGFGIAVEIPEGYEGEIRPRSSVHKNFTLLSNAPGTIDSCYRGEIKAVFYHIPLLSKLYAVGERACQLLIKPVPEVRYIETEELTKTDRGTGGYGSTGK
jgi:dUTP pyrophosphatase